MSGTVVLSLDLELAWGHLDHPQLPRVLEAARYVRSQGFDRLLGLLVERELPATWAAVGAMFGDGFDPAHALEPATVNGRPWEAPVPTGGTASSAPEYFAPPLLDALLAAAVPQEVGFHGWTHLPFPEMTARRRDQELAACRDLAARRGFPGTSFVFPRNDVAGLDALRTHGFTCYRDRDPRRTPRVAGPLGRVEVLLDDWLGRTPIHVRPRVERGLVALPGSTPIRFAEGARRRLPDGWRNRRLRRGVAAAGRSGELFHLWFHPINLHPEPERRLEVVRAWLDDVVAARDAGRIAVRTMGQVAAQALRSAG